MFFHLFPPRLTRLVFGFCFLPFILGACAYIQDDAIQDVTLVTPGAQDALCYMYVEGLRYKILPPQTINIHKSKETLKVDCMAPGNRRKQIYLEPSIEDSAKGNVVTGLIPGLAWDYASGAMFKYPDIIEVSFENTQISEEPLPAQNNPDIKQPEEYDLEEFRPGLPRLNADRYAVRPEIKRRQKPGQYSEYGQQPYMTDNPDGSELLDKGDLMGVINDLNSDQGGSTPVPQYPGE